jgi:hypothetical protein
MDVRYHCNRLEQATADRMRSESWSALVAQMLFTSKSCYDLYFKNIVGSSEEEQMVIALALAAGK